MEINKQDSFSTFSLYSLVSHFSNPAGHPARHLRKATVDERRIILQYMLKEAGEIKHARRLHALLCILQEQLLNEHINLSYNFKEDITGIYSDEIFSDVDCLENVGFSYSKGHFQHKYKLTDLGKEDFNWLKKDRINENIKKAVNKVLEDYKDMDLDKLIEYAESKCYIPNICEEYKEEIQIILEENN